MKIITIGRLLDNDIVLSNMGVSRKHARIIQTGTDVYEIEDTQSKYGTYVNGRKVKGKMSIHPGDRIVLANTPLTTNWKEMFDKLPKDTPQPDPHQQPVSGANHKPKQLPNVLYDFSKNIRLFFEKWDKHCKRIVKELRNTLLLASHQQKLRHYSEELLDLSLERYGFFSDQMSLLLKNLERECSDFQTQYDTDIKKLDITYQYRLSNSHNETELNASLNEVENRRSEMRRLYEDMRRKVLAELNSIIEDFYIQNPSLFPQRLEMASAESSMWEEMPSQRDEIQKNFYMGEEVFNYDILQGHVELRKRRYMRSLYGGNLLFKYSQKKRQLCYDVVNTLIGRMFSAVLNGNMQVVMVDFNDMEGTCNAFKGLNKGVFRIVSQYDEFIQILDAETVHIENVIQNLLQGSITNIAEYNKNKTEKVAYTLLVLKDIPIGYGNEIWTKLTKIMRNGPRAGVSVLAIVNDDEANRTEEALKVFRNLQVSLKSAPYETYDFTISTNQNNQSVFAKAEHYDTFPSGLISTIVKKVNQGLEVKSETILKFSEYMLPASEWWMGYSANRIDLPFGLSTEMKTTMLQITQESGQNSAVVIGIPGSGKSVFLHTIIASAMTYYSPKELQLYLLDFSGVEFDVYASHNLPHARVIAPEAEREFGLSILREVFEEGNRRMTLCRENGVTNIVELKQKNPELIVPRLLVIIDEFQKIFEVENDNISKEANAKIHAIIQEYRKFGINLILATQKLPSKSIVPYDLIANRVVFKSDPNDFNNLIRWPHSIPQPRLLAGTCVYNNESGEEIANNLTRSFFINASRELENLLDRVVLFAQAHPEMTDKHDLRTFRSDELPEFTERIISDRHIEHQDAPREVGVYMGESIAIAPCHVYVPLTKDSNNNILIIGGVPDIAKGIAYHTLLSEVAGHTEKSCNVILMNFMMEDDPMQDVFQSGMFTAISDYCNMQEAKKEEDVKELLQYIKDDVIDVRKSNPSMPLTHCFINIFEFQRGRMFDGVGNRGDLQSKCGSLLEYILRNGPMVGVFTVLQVDNLANLNRLCYGAQNMFCHRIALQMSEQDSDKIVGNSAANKLLVFNRPATNYRGLYYNNVNNSITKFKPYRYGSDSNKQ